jgi:hypothetical protein
MNEGFNKIIMLNAYNNSSTFTDRDREFEHYSDASSSSTGAASSSSTERQFKRCRCIIVRILFVPLQTTCPLPLWVRIPTGTFSLVKVKIQQTTKKKKEISKPFGNMITELGHGDICI